MYKLINSVFVKRRKCPVYKNLSVTFNMHHFYQIFLCVAVFQHEAVKAKETLKLGINGDSKQTLKLYIP